MKKLVAVIAFFLLLAGCQSNLVSEDQVVIEWVDFVKINDTFYEGIQTGILADERSIGEVIGTVEFTVANNVTDPNYKVKNGDAAFHDKGTEIYAVNGQPDVIAIKNERMIHNYQMYFNRDEFNHQWDFKNMPKDTVKKVEFYLDNTGDGSQHLAIWEDEVAINDILHLLIESKEDLNFVPNTNYSEPTYYEMVFYTDEPIAYKFNLKFDGTTFYWDPWNTNTISNEIEMYLDNE